MLVISEETLRSRLNAAITELYEDGFLMDDDWIRAHATRTVVEEIEVAVYKMIGRIEGERQETINKLWYG